MGEKETAAAAQKAGEPKKKDEEQRAGDPADADAGAGQARQGGTMSSIGNIR